jgi:hypothetical protein
VCRQHPGLASGLAQVAVVIGKLAAQVQATLTFVQPGQYLSIRNLLAASLHREVGLPERDDLFLRVSVLDDEVAGVA